MRRRRSLCVVIAFCIITTHYWIAVRSRPFVSLVDRHDLYNQAKTGHESHDPAISSSYSTSFDFEQTDHEEMGEAWRRMTISRIGSRPPNCEHRCGGCSPCRPFQVPTTAGRGHRRLRLHYTNYKPEGWKCKCGASFFNP